MLKFGDSDAAEVGEWVVAIGNPFGHSGTVTAGILSAKGRDLHSGPFDSFLQTDASINPGNSGGPLLNMAGEVIGINTAIRANAQGIGFAIPSNMASQIIEELLLKLKEQYTIVIVTHNLFQARRIADDCIFMLNGQLWEQNTTEELFTNPQRQETRDYLQGVYA